ncbi:hypothetical protein ACFFKU_13320 [Kineococcus gynurae]|uniref:Uncharacterized protein n=1 Tax=Kineococcus gynurae TaxID=452979 RepID=A0ABV5LQB3_9ACTN
MQHEAASHPEESGPAEVPVGAPTEFRPQEIGRLAHLLLPAVDEQQQRRRNGAGGALGRRKSLEETLWTLARLDLLDPDAVRDLLEDSPSPEQIVEDCRAGLSVDRD